MNACGMVFFLYCLYHKPMVSVTNSFKVTILGGAGGVGQPLALLLKQDKLVTEVALYDERKSTPGVALDLSHINTYSCVQGLNKKKNLFEALKDATVVVIAAGKPRSYENMPRQDLFRTNADTVFQLMMPVVTYCPDAFLCVVTNPVNSLMPLVSEFMRRACVYDPRKVFGVTTLNLMRASKFVALMNGLPPSCQYVPVVGGNEGSTIVPLLSQSNPPFMQTSETVHNCIIMQIREAGRKVIQKKNGVSSTLAPAYAIAKFVNSILKGISGEEVCEFAYIRSDLTDSPYFTSSVVLGKCGIESCPSLGHVTPCEQDMINKAVLGLQCNITDSIEYITRRERCIPIQIK